MLLIWRNWCTLCGNEEDTEDILLKPENAHLCILIQKFTSISIDSSNMPTKICTKCNNFLLDLLEFSRECIRIQNMFVELEFNESYKCNDTFDLQSELESIRKKYGLTCFGKIETKNVVNQLVTNNIIESVDHKEQIFENIKIETKEIKDESNEIEIKKNLRSRNTLQKNIKADVENSISNDIEFDDIESCSDSTLMQEDKKIKQTKKINLNKRKRTKKKLSKESLIEKKNKKEINFDCKICKQGFSKKSHYSAHMRRLHSIECSGFPCRYCNKICKAEKALQDHENTHLPFEMRKFRSCIECNKKFTSFGGYWLHMKTYHDDSNKAICDECGKEFSTKRALKSHKFTHTEARPHQCPQCPAKFKHIVGFKAHMETHGENLPCSICGILLSTRYNLKKHMICHDDERKFKCNFCQKDFKRVKSLNSHLIIHIGIKPYECRICAEKFVHDILLRRHIKSSHPIEYEHLERTGGKISKRNYPSLEEFRAINERAAKNPETYTILENKT